MGAVVRVASGARAVGQWLAEGDRLLDEHHLVVWSRNMAVRERYGLEVTKHFRHMPDTQTLVICGAVAHDLDGVCRQLEKCLHDGPTRRIKRSIGEPGGLVDRLRERPSVPNVPAVKHRVYIWRDADALLRQDEKLFAELVDALMGIAAEAEYASEDLLLLHRAVFIGGPKLGEYAADKAGAFKKWLPEKGKAVTPLWQVISGVEKPPVAVMAIG
ncbi:MAG: hypothetical protein ACREJO_03765 [Phycisphaerales bacterium]